MVICLERDADLHMTQLMPLPLTVSHFSKIKIGFTFLVPAHPGSPGLRAVKWMCVCFTSPISATVHLYLCTPHANIAHAYSKLCSHLFKTVAINDRLMNMTETLRSSLAQFVTIRTIMTTNNEGRETICPLPTAFRLVADLHPSAVRTSQVVGGG